jgi:hypothetical protein
MGKREIHTRFWWEKPEGMRWKDNIKTDIKEIGRKGVDWIHPTQDRAQVAGFC